MKEKWGILAGNTGWFKMDDVEVPEENLLGHLGEGFKIAMFALDQGRFTVAAGATGLIRACRDACVAYAKERKTFGTAIANHQLVQWMIAEMAIRAEATRLLYLKAAWNLDSGVRDPIVSSFAKGFGADAAMTTAVDAVQVFGGNGYVKEYPVEKLMRDAKVLQIYEGTSQIQRIVIAKQLLGG
jgi:acyl-CoA dehydrogenase